MADDENNNDIKHNDVKDRKVVDVIECETDDVKADQISRDQPCFFNHGTQTQHHTWLEEMVTEHMRQIGSDIFMQESQLSFQKLFQIEDENKKLRKMIDKWTEQLAALDKKHVDDTDGQNTKLPAKGEELLENNKSTSTQEDENHSSIRFTSPVPVIEMKNNTSTQKDAIFSPARATSPVTVAEMESINDISETNTAPESSPTIEPTVTVDKGIDNNHSSDTFSVDTRRNNENENVLLMQEDFPRPKIHLHHTNENVSSNQYHLHQIQQHQELFAQQLPAELPTQQIPLAHKAQRPPVVHFPQQVPAAMSEHNRRMCHWNMYQENMQSLNLQYQRLQQREEMLAHQAMKTVTPRLYREMQEQFQLRYANQQIPSQHPRYQHQRWRGPPQPPTMEQQQQQYVHCEPATINLKDYGLQQIKQYADARQLHQRHSNVTVNSTTTENIPNSIPEELNVEEHADFSISTPRLNSPSPSQNMNKENVSPPRSVYIIESSSPHSDLYVIKNPSPQKNEEPNDSSTTLNQSNILSSDKSFERSTQQIPNESYEDFPPIPNKNVPNSSSVERQVANCIIDKANIRRGYPIALQPPLHNQRIPQARKLSANERRAIRLKIAVDDVMKDARNEANAAYRNRHEPRSFYGAPPLIPQTRFQELADREQREHLRQLDHAFYQHPNVVYNNQAQLKRRNVTESVLMGHKCRRTEGAMYPQHAPTPEDGQSAGKDSQELSNGFRQTAVRPPPLLPRSNVAPPLLSPRSNLTPPPLLPRSNLAPSLFPPQSNLMPPSLTPQSNVTPPLLPRQSNVTPPLLPPRSNVTPPLLPPRSNMTTPLLPQGCNVTPPILPQRSSDYGKPQQKHHHNTVPSESFIDSNAYLEYMNTEKMYQEYRKFVAKQYARSTPNLLSMLQAQDPSLFRDTSFSKKQVIDATDKSNFANNHVDNVRCIPTPPLSPMSASSHASSHGPSPTNG